MLKRISVDLLVPGMHVHELGGSWIEHSFWRSSFKVRSIEERDRIIAAGIREVCIDTERGLDVEPAPERQEAQPQAEPVEDRAPAGKPSAPGKPRPAGRATLKEELRQAAVICAKSRAAVVTMFSEARMGKAIGAGDAAPLVEEIAGSVIRNPGALISLARLKTADDYTYMHSVAVCALMIALARQLGLGEHETREAGMAGLLHDIGKMAVPPPILNKPGRLSDEEFRLVKGHPEAGYRMLQEGSGVPAIALEVCLHHHEKVDGSGYPHGLSGDGISLHARMGAVCDVYDAITSNRPYKNGWDPAESVRKMAEWSRGHFDEVVFQAFVRSVGIYPVGSLVRLKSGLLGLVVAQADATLLMPKVRVFYSTRTQARISPELIDLSKAGAPDEIVAREDPQRWSFGDLNYLWKDAGAG